MKKEYSRRNFLEKTAAGLVTALVFPTILIASPSTYPYKTPTSRNDLYNIPTNHLLARVIFGEANNCVTDEQIAIAYTGINRRNDNKPYNGKGSLTEVLLHIHNGRHQYDCFTNTSTNPKIITNFQRTLDPAEYDMKNWLKCLEIANQVMSNQYSKLNEGQTSYIANWKIKKWKMEGKTGNWFYNSIPVIIKSPDAKFFKHQFVKDP
ncbi:MAG: hypothetical protein V1888_00745 [archaeon]